MIKTRQGKNRYATAALIGRREVTNLYNLHGGVYSLIMVISTINKKWYLLPAFEVQLYYDLCFEAGIADNGVYRVVMY